MQENDADDWKARLALVFGGALLLILIGLLCSHSCPTGYVWDVGQNCCVDGAGNCYVATCDAAKQIPIAFGGGCCSGSNIWLDDPDFCCGSAPGVCVDSCIPACREKPNGCCSPGYCWNGGRCECEDAAIRNPVTGACCPAGTIWSGTRCECDDPDPTHIIPSTGACCPPGTSWDIAESCCSTGPGLCVTCEPPQREIPGQTCCPLDYKWNPLLPPTGKCECDALQAPGRVMPTGYCCPEGTEWDVSKVPPCCVDLTTQICRISSCGDLSGDNEISLLDIIRLVMYLHGSGPEPPLQVGDVDKSGTINDDDIYYLINYLYVSGPPPCEPCEAGTIWNDERCECEDAARLIPSSGACCPDDSSGNPTTWNDAERCCVDATGTCVYDLELGWYCLGGEPPAPVCGDGTCQGGECGICPVDCTPCCGNGIPEAGETCSSCPGDVGSCGICAPPDGFCNSLAGETCVNCPLDCPPIVNPGPPDYSQNFIDRTLTTTLPHTAPYSLTFNVPAGIIDTATMDIRVDDCGTVTLNGNNVPGPWGCTRNAVWDNGIDIKPYIHSGSNTFDFVITDVLAGYIGYEMNLRVAYSDVTQCCGDGACTGTETFATCPADCPCGDGTCDAGIGETVASCPLDCALPPQCTGIVASPATGTRPLTSLITATYLNVLDGVLVNMKCSATAAIQPATISGGQASITCTYPSAGTYRPNSSYSFASCIGLVRVNNPCLSLQLPCSSETDCCSGECVAPACSHSRCCLFSGDACTLSGECCYGSCVGGHCACTATNSVCTGDLQCCTGHCIGGRCRACISTGQACSDSNDCCSCSCSGGHCVTT